MVQAALELSIFDSRDFSGIVQFKFIYIVLEHNITAVISEIFISSCPFSFSIQLFLSNVILKYFGSFLS